MKIKLEKIISRIDDHIYRNMSSHSQFTIDFFESVHDDVNDKLSNGESENLMDGMDIKHFIAGLSYTVENIIEVCKEGEDKERFKEFNKELEELLK